MPPQQPFGAPPAQQPGFGAPNQMGGYPPPAQPAQAGPGNCWVEVNGVRQQLTRAVTSLGRGTDVDLRIDDPSVSRRHAEIRVGVPSVISDLGSTNGIVVDDQHVRQAQLRDGSVIHLGNTTIIFRQEGR
jgi:pSer/pThr/pTyr-binding forkhead associated (FHA) protein